MRETARTRGTLGCPGRCRDHIATPLAAGHLGMSSQVAGPARSAIARGPLRMSDSATALPVPAEPSAICAIARSTVLYADHFAVLPSTRRPARHAIHRAGDGSSRYVCAYRRLEAGDGGARPLPGVTSPVNRSDDNGALKMERIIELMKVPTVWDERYCVKAAPLTSTTKQARVVRLAAAEGLLDVRRDEGFDASAAWADIGAVHAPQYVQAVRTGCPSQLAQSQGFEWSPAFADSVARIWSGPLAACRLALSERLVLHPVSGAHHAHHERGSGFCTFNFLVGAGRSLLRDGLVRRVAVIDFDAHQGNGTLALVRGDGRFGVFDISSSDWGCQTEGPTIVYHIVRNASGYVEALGRLAAFLDAFRPDLVEYQAGMDCYEEDPLGAVDGLSAERLADRDRLVIRELMDRGVPTVVNLAGGYVEGITEVLHVGTVRVMADARRRRHGATRAA